MMLRLSLWLGTAPSATAPWLALTITYLVHSILWSLAAALLVQRRMLSSAARHLCWKAAFFGPFLSAALASPASARVERAIGVAPCVREISVRSITTLVGASASTAETAKGTAATSEFEARAAHRRSAAEIVAVCGLGAAGLGLLRFAIAALVLRHRLRGRKQTSNERGLACLEAVRGRLGLRRVRLSESSAIESPLVIGATEICIPQALLATLQRPELESVLAHELAHIERGDGFWFPIVGLVQSFFWLHPVNHWVSAAVRRSAELACDDRAVELTRDPLALARALVQVASRASRAESPALAPAMVRSRSVLVSRVARLTDASSDWTRGRRGRAGAIVALTLIGGALGTLTVQVAQARPTASAAQASIVRAHSRSLSGAATALPPNAEEQSRRMAELAQREQRLTSLLEAAQAVPDAPTTPMPDSARVLELNQELRHLRATQVWLEQRFIEESAKWDDARPDLPSTPR
jgi:beta-lactamase regulating signal transducer with metallopeptidase domain